MKNKVMLTLVIGFIVVIGVLVNPKFKELSEEIYPSPPQVMQIGIYLGNTNITGDIILRDSFVPSCAVAFTYSFDSETHELDIYLLDHHLTNLLTNTSPEISCKEGKIAVGTLAVDFSSEVRYLTVTIWNGKSSQNTAYFEAIGIWNFQDGKLQAKIEPPQQQNYKLVSIDELRNITVKYGLYQIKRI
ncbi:hypothetical protein [Thermococcus barophilus]|uniref:Uncharacterized protein n=1 Tax=Thermococcus barophilus TaxID=55802 RepID=A0A0S1X974_THEBA|nr:hypothetical protein [Thermococcus barophilus]ALM74255.1 hypothetical protein TBCH5v1_0277 [Thermococcus barophilus]